METFFPGTGLATSVSSHAIGETSPPLSPITMSHTTPSIYSNLNTAGHNTYQGIQGGKQENYFLCYSGNQCYLAWWNDINEYNVL